jgi:sulfur carrier protein ThiS
MRITVKLAGPLRKEVEGLRQGELELELAAGSTVGQAVERLGLGSRVRMLLLNGRPLLEDRELAPGDRLFLMPPELAYNMYVATGFLAPGAREDIRRGKGNKP